MRIALHPVGEVGTRVGKILLAERSLDRLGVLGNPTTGRGDPRVEPTGDPSGYPVYVSDDLDDPAAHARRALATGVSCVLWADPGDELETLGEDFLGRDLTLLAGANLAGGIGPCLASHESTHLDEVLDVTCAWTEPGRPLRRGEPVPFPDPVGPRWARGHEPATTIRRLVAPVTGDWAGAMVRVTAGTPEGVVTRILGVADLAVHLEALALAAGALTIGGYPSGLVTPADRPEPYLAAALDAGLDVASYTVDHETRV